MNNHNLRPPTHAEAVERGRKGGLRSGEVRRERKTMRECLEILLNMRETDPKILKELEDRGLAPEEITQASRLAMVLIDKAIQGDLKSAIFIRDTIGEKPELNIKSTAGIRSNQSKITIYKVTD